MMVPYAPAQRLGALIGDVYTCASITTDVRIK